MTRQTYMPEEAMIKKGIEALMSALGPVETARFLSLPRYRYADYVEWHHQWQETLDQTEFFDQVFGTKPSDAK